MSKPNVLFLDQSGALGGAELYLLDVARHYRDTSRVVLFEDGPFRERLHDQGIEVDVLKAGEALHDVRKQGGFRKAFRALPSLVKLIIQLTLRARDCDIVYANSQKALIAGAIAARLARRPLVWNLHDLLTASHFSSTNRRLAVGFANWFAQRVIVNSEATREAFIASGGQRQKTRLVYNGIDVGAFESPSPDAACAARRELGIDAERPLLGVFSRLAHWKGQHVLMEALPQLPEGTHVLLVGDALFDGDAEYKRKLDRMAERLNVRNRIHFLGFRDDVPRLMKAVDIVVHTSIAPEPFGRVIVEGMLARRPVIATAAGGALEIIDDEHTGRLVPPGDPDVLAEAVTHLLKRPEEARQMGRAGHAVARERFSTESMLTAIDHHLQEIL